MKRINRYRNKLHYRITFGKGILQPLHGFGKLRANGRTPCKKEIKNNYFARQISKRNFFPELVGKLHIAYMMPYRVAGAFAVFFNNIHTVKEIPVWYLHIPVTVISHQNIAYHGQ